MPAVSKAQRKLMAIAEHNPAAVSAENKGVTEMAPEQLHDFAKTKETKLPEHKGRGFGSKLRSGHGRHPKPRAGY